MAFTYTAVSGLSKQTICKTVQYELIRALHERQNALNMTKTTFYTGPSTQTSSITAASNLVGLPILGRDTMPISDQLAANMERLFTGLRALVNGATAINGGKVRAATSEHGWTFYTTATLETAVGLGSYDAVD